MFFILSKVLSFLLTPIVWIFFLLVGALFFKSPKRKKRFALAAILVTFLFSNGFVMNEVNRQWETPILPDSELGHYEYGIVLGGFSHYDSKNDRMFFYGSSGRLWHAVRLYHQGYFDKFLLSGGSGRLIDRHILESETVRNFLLDCNIPEEDIVMEATSKNTRENALNTAELLAERSRKKQQLLITSASHMPRAKACFEKVGLNVQAYAIGQSFGPRNYYFDTLFVPRAEILWKWNYLMHEWVGYLIYKIRGYA